MTRFGPTPYLVTVNQPEDVVIAPPIVAACQPARRGGKSFWQAAQQLYAAVRRGQMTTEDSIEILSRIKPGRLLYLAEGEAVTLTKLGPPDAVALICHPERPAAWLMSDGSRQQVLPSIYEAEQNAS